MARAQVVTTESLVTLCYSVTPAIHAWAIGGDDEMTPEPHWHHMLVAEVEQNPGGLGLANRQSGSGRRQPRGAMGP